jgi:putative ABC transport system permease protein
MRLGQLIIESFESLSANKVRSALTMLGIVIGVAAVVALMSIGNGTQSAITSQIESIGTNLLYVSSGGDATNPKPLTIQDAAALLNAQVDPAVSRVAPIMQGQVEASVPGESSNTSLLGVTPDFFLMQDITVAEGAQISTKNVDDYASVVMIGSKVAENLFNGTTGLAGKTVRLNGQVFKVIAVLESAGGTGFGNSDNRVLVPLSTARLRLLSRDHPDEVDQIYVQAASSDVVNDAITDVTQILRARHRTLGVDDFEILSTQSFLETATAITGTLTLFLGGIAGISLLVGGIGIMNIMLVTVTERTREIGLRKALGARRRDILLQFLIESSLLSLGGGLIGVSLGWGISKVVGQIATANGTSLNPVVTLQSVLLATLFAACVGLFFGIYPANRASGLAPVEALRTD